MATTAERLPVNIEDEMRRSYMDYAMSVIIGRALPDVRDGLKPAHRRVVYGMRLMGLTSNRTYRKCAKIVGDVMGNYHPHGDSAIYDALARMTQNWSMRVPLIDGQTYDRIATHENVSLAAPIASVRLPWSSVIAERRAWRRSREALPRAAASARRLRTRSSAVATSCFSLALLVRARRIPA